MDYRGFMPSMLPFERQHRNQAVDIYIHKEAPFSLQSKYVEAEALHFRAIEIQETGSNPFRRPISRSCNNLAHVLTVQVRVTTPPRSVSLL